MPKTWPSCLNKFNVHGHAGPKTSKGIQRITTEMFNNFVREIPEVQWAADSFLCLNCRTRASKLKVQREAARNLVGLLNPDVPIPPEHRPPVVGVDESGDAIIDFDNVEGIGDDAMETDQEERIDPVAPIADAPEQAASQFDQPLQPYQPDVLPMSELIPSDLPDEEYSKRGKSPGDEPSNQPPRKMPSSSLTSRYRC
jgi:hypothetical protein